MEMSELAKNITSSADKFDYRSKLHQMQAALKAATVQVLVVPTPRGPDTKLELVVDITAKGQSSTASPAAETQRPLSARKRIPPPSSEAPVELKAAQQVVHEQIEPPKQAQPSSLTIDAVSSGSGGLDRIVPAAAPDLASGKPAPSTEADTDEAELTEFESLPGWNECLFTSMFSAAHHAAYYGYTQVLECLSKYFDVFICDSHGRTPLFYACLANRFECVVILVAIGNFYRFLD
jgi:hypothetical protein